MKPVIIIFLLLNSFTYAQNLRFTYDYKYVSDTLNKDAVTNEVVILDYDAEGKKSIFTGLKHIISDSTMTAEYNKGLNSLPDGSTKVRYVIEKKNNSNTIDFYTTNHTSDRVLKVRDDRKINWKISDDKEKIMGYTAQKATAIFAGRYWAAWFTTEIPITDGPYKFNGLPGLILKIYDKTNTHSFEITSVNKQRSNYVVLEDNSYQGTKQITLRDYQKMPDSLELFRRKAFTGEVFFHNNEEKQNFLKDIDAQIKESKVHNNNPIELASQSL